MVAPTGHSFSLRRMQTHDGPGMRTTVFMKGCPLQCAWCHNPESLSPAQEVWWLESRCIGCKTCVEVCEVGAIEARETGIFINRDTCTGCTDCVVHCPAKAIEALRSDWSVDKLFETIYRDRHFLKKGGVTVSGGEPAIQWPFVSELLKRCKEAGFHTALDTCGMTNWDAYEAIIPHCDLILFDVKIIEPDAHKKWTGQRNERILDNLKQIAQYVRSNPDTRIWIRTPLIPGASANQENIKAIAEFIRDHLSGAVDRWELCSFNNLCTDKYQKLGKTWSLAETPLLQRSTGEEFLKTAQDHCGLPPENVFLKGRMLEHAQ